ncbi:MAG: DNA polymerase III subunit delta [Pseudohongiellaceae bacterium]|nr:DNA polymerase III subunit delta [Pseudohongiellaceae bacterium]
MRINSDKLEGSLSKGLATVYWIAGDETLLVQEALDAVRSKCRAQQFDTRDLFFVDKQFQWQDFLASSNSMSLFAEKKIIELRFQSPKIEDEARKLLAEYCQSPNPDNALIIVTPKLDASALNTKWFKAIESHGVFVQVWPIDINRLPAWIDQRMQSHGLVADRDAISLLADRVEGNLLAADQEIEKLKVLTGATRDNRISVTADTIMKLVADSARYNVFNLIDSALVGDSARTLKILSGLKAEGTELLNLLGMATREIRILLNIRYRTENGQALASAMQQEGVRRIHEPPVRKAIEHSTVSSLESLLISARDIDATVKGLAIGDPWNKLGSLLIGLGGKSLCIEDPI